MSAAIERVDRAPYTAVPGEVPLPTDPPEKKTAWIAERMKSIGASDASAAAGLSRWRTPLDVYREKRGEVPPADLSANKKVRLGLLQEDLVAKLYEEDTGRELRRVRRLLRSREFPFMHATLDRRVVGESRVVEIKTTGTYAFQAEEWGEPPHGPMPIPYGLQLQHQLAVTGYERADLIVLVGNDDWLIYERERDEKMIADLVTIERELWDRIERGEPPPPINMDDLRALYPESVEARVEANAEMMRTLDNFRAAKADKKNLDALLDTLQFKIAAYMGDADTLTVYGERALTYKTQTRKAFAVAESTSRVMRLLKEKSE